MKKHVWRLIMDFEKEEAWLNQMCQLGWHYERNDWARYTFQKATPSEYIYRIQYLDKMPSSAESQAYIEFLESSGIEHVHSYMSWIYLRKKTSEGPFNLITDLPSRISHYKKIANMFGIIGGVNVYLGLINSKLLFHPRSILSETFGWLPLLNLVLGLYILTYVFKLVQKINRLNRERQLHE